MLSNHLCPLQLFEHGFLKVAIVLQIWLNLRIIYLVKMSVILLYI